MAICWKTLGFRRALDALYFSGAHRLLEPVSRGIGLIYMLHRVLPERNEPFQPNHFLEVTPDFLEHVIERTREAGVEFVSLDEAHDRLKRRAFDRRFAAMTFDDGYRDNVEHALPILKRHGVPFTVYASSGITDGTCELWWIAVERIVAAHDRVVVEFEGHVESLDCADTAEKFAAHRRLCHWLSMQLDEQAQRRAIRKLAADHGLDLDVMCRSLAMDWDELRALAGEPLATIGAHTLSHHAVARLSAEEAERQIGADADRLEVELGARPAHFAYPYGSAVAAGPRDFAIADKLGFKTAVTTRAGQLFSEHADHLTALPRVSLNGEYQRDRYVTMFLGGAPMALYNGFRHLNVA